MAALTLKNLLTFIFIVSLLFYIFYSSYIPGKCNCTHNTTVSYYSVGKPFRSDISFPSTVQNDRMTIISGAYGNVDVTHALRKMYKWRRLRITTATPLNFFFGDNGDSNLVIEYSYRGVTKKVDIPVRADGKFSYLTSDLVIPDNLVEDTIEEKNEMWKAVTPLIKGKKGLEIGGFSPVFVNELTYYADIGVTDNINFAAATLWEHNLKDNGPFNYMSGKPPGKQYIIDMTNMKMLERNNYEVIACCHVLEHIVNPLKAVKQVVEILVPGGIFIIVVPYKYACFDHFRDFVTMNHLLEEYNANVTEDDISHVEEVVMLSDLAQDGPAGTYFQFLQRSIQNPKNRAVHQHVFHHEVLHQMCEWAGLKLVHKDRRGLHVLAVCQKDK